MDIGNLWVEAMCGMIIFTAICCILLYIGASILASFFPAKKPPKKTKPVPRMPAPIWRNPEFPPVGYPQYPPQVPQVPPYGRQQVNPYHLPFDDEKHGNY